MSRREMKVSLIETKMVGIDRRAPSQNKIMDSDFIQLNNSVQITQQDFKNIPDVVVPENGHNNSERCMPRAHLEVQNHDFMLTAKVCHKDHLITKRQFSSVHFITCAYTRRKFTILFTETSNYGTIVMFRRQ